MSKKLIQASFELRRRIDGVVYRYRPCEPIDGHIAWKREGVDVWITQIKGFGWVCIDNEGTVCGIPWGIADNEIGELPPAGEWVSKKGDKSYVYDCIYI